MQRENSFFMAAIRFILLLLLSSSIPSILTHPFDPLSPLEIKKVTSIIKSNFNFHHSERLTFHYVGIDEPNKPSVLSWLANPRSPPPPRQAFAIVRANGQTYEFVVSLGSRGNKILSQKIYKGKGFPVLSIDEQTEAIELSLKHPPFISSIKKRGLKVSEVIGSVFTVGWYGEAEPKRIVKVLFFNKEGSINVWVRPIEGIEASVDLDKMVITEYKDTQISVMPKGEGTEYQGSFFKPPFAGQTKPITVHQPHGPSFIIRDHTISWANWDMHLGFDMRAGIVISSASIYDYDQSRKRQVLYKGQISELFVPYQDPTEEWYYRTFLDAGEFGMGSCAVSLEPFNDCPSNAAFFDGYYTNQDGEPVKLSNVVCVFEKYAGNIAWRHTEVAIPGEVITEVRPEVSLVIRMITVIGNYDYILDWEFKTSGSIKFRVSLTGIMEGKTTVYSHTSEIKEEIYGRLVAPNTIGINHDHFLTYYLDLDIDGQDNSFVKAKLKSFKTDGSTPRKSYWTVVEETAKTELDARIRLTEPSEFHIVNPNSETKIGNKVGYRLFPGPDAVPLLSEDDYPQIRGSLSDYNIWVTPYNQSEKWAGGLYVDRGPGDHTIKVFTQRNREINNKDIVLWHTIGFHHNTNQDEFPIMPTLSGGFELRPANFFERNPILRMKPPGSDHAATANATTIH